MEADSGGDNSKQLQRTATCIGFSEIDRYAIKVYERNFNGHKQWGDITAIDTSKLPDFDLLVGGFPCQAFSIAGKRKGFADTRGTLFFDIARICRDKRPRHILLENVKGLLSHDSGKTFQTILTVLTDIGYRIEWQVLNSKDFGVPQNRERVFIVGHLGNDCRGQVFPLGQSGAGAVESQRQTRGEGKRIRGNTARAVAQRDYKGGNNLIKQLNSPTHSNNRVYGDKGVSPALNTAQGGNRQPKIVAMQWRRTEKGKQARAENQAKGKDYTPFSDGHRELVPRDGKAVGAITSQAIAKDSLLGDHTRIRKLTPTECERLQGFPDNFSKYGIGDEPISDTQRYKMMGNAVTTNVIEAIMRSFSCIMRE